jgi:glycosyltransferase involved in cell wall biosynthesis
MPFSNKIPEKCSYQNISIAMCTYNGSKYIVDQLKSFINQTRLPNELVVCDDASKDDTVEIIQGYVQKCPFPIRIFSNSTNLGPTKNFEKAIELTTGDIVLLSDQDDVWHNEKIQRMGEMFQQCPQMAGVFTDANVVDERLNAMGYRMWQRVRFTDREQQLVLSGQAHRVLLKHYVVTGASMAFRAEFKPLILPIPTCWFHDAWIALLLAFASRLSIIQEPLVFYRQHTTNVIGARVKKLWDEVPKARKVDRSRYYQEEIERLEQLHTRLRRCACYTASRSNLDQVEAKLEHLRRRAGMPKNRFFRLPIIFCELVSLRYRRFAKNWQSVLMDMFWRG